MATININGYDALVDDEDAERVLSEKWTVSKWGLEKGYFYFLSYEHGKRGTDTYRPHISLHRFILGVKDRNILVDHKDMNTLNCQKSNLRKCTKSQNMMNRNKTKSNSSGYKGVSWAPWAKKWRAQIKAEKRLYRLGYFTSPQDAYAAYCEAAKKYHGPFARAN